ncbi:efflux RND transporter periplasmic adaptor subunit [Aestuariibacter halophilus]|uniref:Efflux RND transporter periplasmic adaptor subunit n=1 Tax=Fluctibacter halophilus TaxID=226011 RepID=A0ABS8G3D7_9ALTE|nr:efflux RND transporter periplasmic adaptor subunit [Aestuariibacter halophilus]MCC2615043.1 efflux RND transporter periplasmic adaptor subunit [Aestuariibacter halophilus]
MMLKRPLPLLMIVSAALLSACSKVEHPEPATTPRLVKTLTLNERSVADWREFPGVVEAAQTADLGFRVPGTLASIKVKEGERVSAGDVLAMLDDTDYQIQLDSRRAEFEQADADYQRAKNLIKQNLIAKADFDKLEAQQASAKAALTSAEQNVKYTVLKAPFDGRVARRHVDNFEDVSTMQPIVTLQDVGALHIKVDIPETVMIHLKEDADAKVFASFDALSDKQYPLALQAVATEADPGSRTFAVTFNMPQVPELNILPGMSVTVRGTQQDSNLQQRIVVPTQTVVETNTGRYVYLVTDIQDDRGTVVAAPVTTGQVTEQGIVILEGLKAGDRIVTAGMSKMSDGITVRVSEEWSQ